MAKHRQGESSSFLGQSRRPKSDDSRRPCLLAQHHCGGGAPPSWSSVMRPTTLSTLHRCNSRPPPSVSADAATQQRPRSRTSCRAKSFQPVSRTFPLTTRRHFSSTEASLRVSRCWTDEIRDPSCDDSTEPCPPFLLVVGYSEGTIVAEKVRRDLKPGVDGAPPADGLRFVMIASPNVPNGGIFRADSPT